MKTIIASILVAVGLLASIGSAANAGGHCDADDPFVQANHDSS